MWLKTTSCCLYYNHDIAQTTTHQTDSSPMFISCVACCSYCAVACNSVERSASLTGSLPGATTDHRPPPSFAVVTYVYVFGSSSQNASFALCFFVPYLKQISK